MKSLGSGKMGGAAMAPRKSDRPRYGHQADVEPVDDQRTDQCARCGEKRLPEDIDNDGVCSWTRGVRCGQP